MNYFSIKRGKKEFYESSVVRLSKLIYSPVNHNPKLFSYVYYID